jgi:outer membrane protein OmpA-like peptidoglycan-associated protein
MKYKANKFLILLILLAVSAAGAEGQTYAVSKAGFSAERYDDFSPVKHGKNLVFCSSRKHEVLVVYSTPESGDNVNMWSVSLNDTAGQYKAQIFSEELLSSFNDGPATFNAEGTLIYYSRNIEISSKLRDVFDSKNQLGLFQARLVDGVWTDISPFPYNSTEYSNTTPALTPDGKRIYFASNMPGGFGGADLYYCDMVDGEWSSPVNLGSNVNSTGNESYPFVNEEGILYFSSDGWLGLGKKDIFYTLQEGDEWVIPVAMDAHVNSKADDFGIYTNREGTEGFFSSNRQKKDNIYSFVTDIPPFYTCDSILKNFYCYLFYDEGFMDIDTMPLSYEWSFSDGVKVTGMEAEHCFPGAGQFLVELNIIDNNTGNTFFTQASYEVEISDAVQPYISSADVSLKDKPLAFSAVKTNLPDMPITQYYWDFDDGINAKGMETEHTFERKGIYKVRMGVTGKPDSTGFIPKACVYKMVEVLEDNQELAMYQAVQKGDLDKLPQAADENPSTVSPLYSMKEAEEKDAVYRVEVLNSPERVNIDTSLFDPLRGAYDITEVFLREDSIYSYTVGEAASVMESYSVYSDVVGRGFENASVKSYILADLAEEELLQLTSTLGEFADAYFEFDDYKITEASYPIMDQVVTILNRYPAIRLEIAAHTDNMGSFEYNMTLSQKRTQSMIDYLVSQGIESSRLVGKGYGESRPIASNSTEEGRMMNRRVEFIILDETK